MDGAVLSLGAFRQNAPRKENWNELGAEYSDKEGKYTNPRHAQGQVNYAGQTLSNQLAVENAMTSPTREELKASIEAAEARTDTKITRLEGKLDLVLNELVNVRTDSRSIKSNVWAVGLGLAALLVGMLSFGATTWYNGSVIGDHIEEAVKRAVSNSSK